MSIETFANNVGTAFSVYHHEPSDAFQTTICAQIPCHIDGIGKNEGHSANQTQNLVKKTQNLFQFLCSIEQLVVRWILHVCAYAAPALLFAWISFYTEHIAVAIRQHAIDCVHRMPPSLSSQIHKLYIWTGCLLCAASNGSETKIPLKFSNLVRILWKAELKLTSYCALVPKTSEHDEHLYEADDRKLDFRLEQSGRRCLCRARAAALKWKVRQKLFDLKRGMHWTMRFKEKTHFLNIISHSAHLILFCWSNCELGCGCCFCSLEVLLTFRLPLASLRCNCFFKLPSGR